MPSCCLWVVQQMPSCTKRQVNSCTFHVSIFLKDIALRCFFTLLAKLSGISEYLNVLIWSNVCRWSFVCRDEVLANAHSWHRHEYCYPCGKVKSKIINIACCSNFLPFCLLINFFFILNFNQQYVILNIYDIISQSTKWRYGVSFSGV